MDLCFRQKHSPQHHPQILHKTRAHVAHPFQTSKFRLFSDSNWSTHDHHATNVLNADSSTGVEAAEEK